MPIYEYECPLCQKTVEIERLLAERDDPVRCNQIIYQPDAPCLQHMKRVISRTSFVLKGDGWAKDGYRK